MPPAATGTAASTPTPTTRPTRPSSPKPSWNGPAAAGAAPETRSSPCPQPTATGQQSLTWNDQGQLQAVTTASAGSSYIYDADGNLLLQKDPGTSTLYLPGEQVALNTSTKAVTATRFYALPGGGQAVRSGTGSSYYFELTDQHNTSTLTLSNTLTNPVWRQQTPYGAPRGTAPTSWPDNHGFLNKPQDTTTGLTDVGARWYDPFTGTFASLDPVLEPASPQQLNGYSYAGANPVAGSDPSGLVRLSDGDGTPPDSGGRFTNANTGQGGVECAYGTMEDGSCLLPGRNDTPADLALTHRHHLLQQISDYQDKVKQLHDEYKQWEANQAHCGGTGSAASGIMCYGWAKISSLFTNYNGEITSLITQLLPLLASEDPPAAAAVELGEEADASTLLGDAAGAASAGDTSGAIAETEKALQDAQDELAKCAVNSFVGTTLVLMADGSSKPIDQIKVGDKIANNLPGADPGTKDQVHTVTAIHVTYTDRDYTDVSIDTGHGPATITGTAHHPYWDETTRAWTEADQLHPGDHLQTSDGYSVTVLALRDYTATAVTYNLTVDGLHTYYVEAGLTPVLVHNDGSDSTVGTIFRAGKYVFQIYSDDHGPPHGHLKGNGFDIQIGQNGKPLSADTTLTRDQQNIIDDNLGTIRDSIGKRMAAYKLNGC